MNPSKFEILLQKLLQRTSSGEINWEKTTDDSQFQAVLGGYIIRFSERYESQTIEPDYYLRIIDQEGSTIESISDVEINRANPDFKAFLTMSEIYRLARRSAMGADKAIDSIIEELDSIIPF